MNKKIYLFTNCYPYGKIQESFLQDEMKAVELCSELDIIVIPLHTKKIKREIPKSKITVWNDLAERSFLFKLNAALNLFFCKELWQIPFLQKRPKNLYQFIYGIKYLYGAILVKEYLISNKIKFDPNGIFYSYWSNHTILGFAWAKKKDSYFENINFYSRAHGYDVYEEKVNIYMPYRDLIFGYMKKVFVVSNYGLEFLKGRYFKYKEHFELSRLGVFSYFNGNMLRDERGVSFVSCSRIIPLKRVLLIYSTLYEYALSNKDLNIIWTHMGDGIEMEVLRKKISLNTLSNFTVKILGNLSQKELISIYQNNYFDIFLNFSTSEGVPVSIMEAISYGIPAIATNVGGNGEIVTESTGLLIPVDFTQEMFTQAVEKILEGKEDLRESTLSYYSDNYNAESNYKKFYENQID